MKRFVGTMESRRIVDNGGHEDEGMEMQEMRLSAPCNDDYDRDSNGPYDEGNVDRDGIGAGGRGGAGGGGYGDDEDDDGDDSGDDDDVGGIGGEAESSRKKKKKKKKKKNKKKKKKGKGSLPGDEDGPSSLLHSDSRLRTATDSDIASASEIRSSAGDVMSDCMDDDDQDLLLRATSEESLDVKYSKSLSTLSSVASSISEHTSTSVLSTTMESVKSHNSPSSDASGLYNLSQKASPFKVTKLPPIAEEVDDFHDDSSIGLKEASMIDSQGVRKDSKLDLESSSTVDVFGTVNEENQDSEAFEEEDEDEILSQEFAASESLSSLASHQSAKEYFVPDLQRLIFTSNVMSYVYADLINEVIRTLGYQLVSIFR
jgi:hypothetical protein